MLNFTFKEGKVKYIYFVAETKGTMSTMELRDIEKDKIKCTQRFFNDVLNKKDNNHPVKYGMINSYDKLIEAVR
ncbi:MAG: hypothetical protein U9R17_06255 [Thermodesulfobacteriota bacterium]|nr:hypothetical protein [Thermodesulfobacteriota bacterium]